MRSVVVWGAGHLGGAVARRLADGGRVRRVVLVDADVGTAKGKALDIRQAATVDGGDCVVEGVGRMADAGTVDAVVVADPPELADRTLSANLAGDLARTLIPAVGRGVLVVAGLAAPPLLEAAVARGLPRTACLGSAPLALMAALRRRLAWELEVEPREIAATLLGRPPDHLVLPQGAATVGGLPVDRLAAAAPRRALGALRGRTPGPLALAAAAARVVQALGRRRATVLPVFAVLDGEYGQRGVVLAVPARLRDGRLQAVIEYPLDPVDRVALDGAVDPRRRNAGAPD